ncbi:hypothetical protein AALP_AA6G197000 [Arabis alpina]|uniref:Uncharacterized protein n=1 Tax=Arabis alpina TaxID=50452 RepID=A0A087GQC8_ARAAL|nr:hypothetical protein AALP_AA6G197000 [Arabis alpina]
MTKEAKDAREQEKAAGNKIGMLDQLERERNEKDVKILSLKEENEKLKTAADAEEVNRLNSLINQVTYSLELYAELKADEIAVPNEKVERLQDDLKRLNTEFDALDVEVAKPDDYLVTPVADRTPLDLSNLQLDFGEGSHARSNHEEVVGAETEEIPPGEGRQYGEDRQGEQADVVDASTNESLDPLFPTSAQVN